MKTKIRTTETLSLSLDREIYAALDRFATKMDLPRSRIVNTLIERSINRWEKMPAREEATI